MDVYNDPRRWSPDHRAQLREFGFYADYIGPLYREEVNPRLTEIFILYQHFVGSENIASFPSGRRIQALREDNEISLINVANQSGVEKVTIEEIEAGNVDPDAHTVEQILNVLPKAKVKHSYPNKPHLKEQWKDHVMKIAKETGRLPTLKQAKNHPEAPEIRPYVVFDGIDDLLESLPIENNYITGNAPLREHMIEELQLIYERTGNPPKVRDIKNQGKYSYNYYKKEFGGLTNARKVAGVNTSSKNIEKDVDKSKRTKRRPTQEELIKELQNLNEVIEGTPRTSDMNEIGKYSTPTYYNVFDTWNQALAAAGIETDRATRTTDDPTQALTAELQRLAKILGRRPKTTDVREDSKFSLGRYYSHYDSWGEAIEDADL